jgi:hypothetical protein
MCSMTNTLFRRRASRSFGVHRTSRPPHSGILVVEHEFEGGPLAGRRMTGFASTFDMQVVRSERGRRPRLVVHTHRYAPIGTYRFVRGYDCARTLERVHVYRWHASREPHEG